MKRLDLKGFWNKSKTTLRENFKSHWKQKLVISLIMIIMFILDIVIKDIVKNTLQGNPSIVATSDLSFAYRTNPGVSFGILSNDADGATAFQAIVTIIVLFGIIFSNRIQFTFAFAWIFAGGFANLIDRFDDGEVIDFIKLGPNFYFNVADTYVMIGIAFMLYALFTTSINDEDDVKKIGFGRKKSKETQSHD